MLIKKLKIENLRNLREVDITPNPKLNVLFGGNGAGKTSVLESLVVLSRGRSFRTSQADDLTGTSGKTFRVFAEIENTEKKLCRLGLERSGKHWRARKDGEDLTQLSQLSRALPLVIMEPNSHLLVSGPPEIRRKYLDWGMFHVERDFLDIYRRYSKILKQRNAALRSKQRGVLESIDEVISNLGVSLTHMREKHLHAVMLQVRKTLEQLNPGLAGVGLDYEKGWKSDSLKKALSVSLESDIIRGATGVGPHRADIVMTLERSHAKSVLSRGEQKMLSAALLLSQAEIFQANGIVPIILMDDLASEFDQDHFENVLQKTRETGCQIWITGTGEYDSRGECTLFHVEHGMVREMV